MSGFAGIVRLDDRPIEPATTAALQAAIAHRGTDANGAWSDAHATLAHAMLWTTPESLTESQPRVEGSLAIVADARIDNRDALIAALDLDRSAGDAAILLAAYRRWNHECVAHLDGDFAFAIYDARERSLFAARDVFGVKPFVYALAPSKQFAFASEVRALLAAGVDRTIDDERVRAFLAISFPDFERTFYAAIRRLPGGCTLTMRDGNVRVARYWSPRSIAPAPRRSDHEFADGFREHLERAVRVRMRVPPQFDAGSLLSGGLDSSAISAVASTQRAQPLHVFSWIFSDAPDADEREFQERAAAGANMRRHVLDSATQPYTPWSGFDELLPDGPPYAPNMYLNLGAATLARSLGIRALLDGLGGDATISRGNARLIELLVHGRVRTLARELRALAQHTNASPSRLFATNVVAPVAPPWLFHVTRFLRRLPRAEFGPYAPHFSARAEHIAQLESPLLAEGLELFDRVHALAGVEGRYPFFDRRLVEYCVSLPADQKLAGGYSRVVARRAVDGIAPAEVAWRAGKGKPGLHVVPALRAQRPKLDDVFERDPSALAPYADVDRLRTTYRAFIDSPSPDFMMAVRLWAHAAACCWLRQAR